MSLFDKRNNNNLNFMKHLLFYIVLLYTGSYVKPIFAQQAKIDSLEMVLKTPIHDTTRINVFNNLVRVFLLSRPDSAVFYATKAETLAKQLKNTRKECAAINNKGKGYWKVGNLPKALQSFNESYSIALKNNYQPLVFTNLTNIALVYESMGNYEVSIRYHHKLLQLALETTDNTKLGITYHNLGQAYTNLAKYDSAEYFLLKSVPYAQKYVEGLETFAYFNLGDAKWREKNYEAATTYLLQTIPLAEKYSDAENLCSAYRILAAINLEKGNIAEAYQQISKAVTIVEKSQIKENMYPIYGIYSKILERKGEFQQALKYKDLFIVYKDSIQSETAKNGLQIFEYEKTQSEIAVLKAEQAQKDTEQRFWLFTLCGVSISILFVAFAIFRSRTKIKDAYGKLSLANIEINQQKEELQTTNEELYQTQEEILAQRDLLEERKNLLEMYNYKISKSIEAALLIQKAVLPPKNKMTELFGEYFVLFRPKDIVSGDFWWANELDGEKYLIVADCTGHGVSGAMLTMMGSALLDRIIRLLHITQPSEILERLHHEIKDLLQQEQTHSTEGMDIAIAHWHYTNDACSISFAAAKRPIYHTSPKGIEKVTGSRKNIGGFSKEGKKFENHFLSLPKGTSLYLCSDGYIDQNDAERTNFSEKRLMHTLEEIQLLPMFQQKQVLKDVLAMQLVGVEQRDDILLIGVRL